MSLVEVTKDTRILLKILGALVVLSIFVFAGIKVAQLVQKTYFPTPPPPPENKFGTLPPIEFPKSDTFLPTFKINTVSGFLPTFPTTVKVYKFKANEPTITALPDARIRVSEAGYVLNEEKINSTTYKWTKNNGLSYLYYDIYSFNFNISPNFSQLSLSPIGQIENENYISTISNLINTLGANTDDIDFNKTKYSHYSLIDNNITEVNNTNATITSVNLFQKKVDDIEIYYPSKLSTLIFNIALADNNMQIIEGSYFHFVPNLSESSRYAIKTSEEAFESLKAGDGYIAIPTNSKTVDIVDASIGYYIGNSENQEYLMPIVVFKGTNNFLAYVSAIKN